jgi:chromosome segregation ATPase
LTVLEYKTQQEALRAAALDEQAGKKQHQLDGLEKKVKVTQQAAVMFSEIEGMAKKSVFGGKMELSPADWKTVSGLAKNGVVLQAEVKDLKGQLADAKKEIRTLKDAYHRLLHETRTFREAVKSAPKRVMAFLQGIISRNHQQRETERTAKRQKGEPSR